MTDPVSAVDGFAWLSGAGGGAGGMLLTLGGLKLYGRFFPNGAENNSKMLEENIRTLTTGLHTHHEKELDKLEDIHRSIGEMNAYLKGVLSR